MDQDPAAAAAAVRAALQQAMTGDEPPIRPGIIGGALVEARRIRRWRRLAGASAVAALVPAIAVGLASAHRPAGPAGPAAFGRAERTDVGVVVPGGAALRSNPGPATISVAPAKHRLYGAPATHQVSISSPPAAGKVILVRPVSFGFVRPVLPAAKPAVNPVPITAQSFGQLLVDDLPAHAIHTQIMATVTSAGGQDRLSLANFDDVTTAYGAGSLSLQLVSASTAGMAVGCGELSAGETCRTYQLGSGVVVNETAVDASWESDTTVLAVTVFRPGTGLISIEENTLSATEEAAGAQPPLTLGQLVAAAMDPRWGYTIGKAFAQRASGLYVQPATGA
jgi:hypothetical protein